ncbi:MAG: glycerophosphodiester phosphodiesterase family protein [Myxococcota bacterium]
MQEAKRALVIAHRGASGDRPENTLPAFEEAIAQGADMIETDLHLSRDGVVVIHHDAGLDRLGEEGEIRGRTASELAALDAAPGAPGTLRMPTLLDVLDNFAERIDWNLELKVGLEAPYEGIEELVLGEVEARGLLRRVIFSCFDDSVLERLRAGSREARLGVLVSPRAPQDVFARAERVSAEAIHPHTFLVDADLVAGAHDRGLAVYPYTANEPEEMARLLDLGVDGVITNHPRVLGDLLRARESAAE